MPTGPTIASYTDGEAFQAEKRTLFSSAWLPVCHAAQLAASGDFISQGVGGWPVFALRGHDGVLRVFRNMCRHQQMQVVEKPSGNCTELRCRYHGWTYDLQGCFASAPDPVAPADPAAPSNHLIALASRDAAGFILFTLGDRAQGAPDDVASAVERVNGPYAGNITTEIGCNWKTYLEARLERSSACGWPLLLVEQSDGGVIAEQVVPRTFLRTRVVFHALGAQAVASSLPAHAQQAKLESEALQVRRAAGDMPQLAGRMAMLWDRLNDSLAADARTS